MRTWQEEVRRNLRYPGPEHSSWPDADLRAIEQAITRAGYKVVPIDTAEA